MRCAVDHEAIKAEPFRFVIELDQIGMTDFDDETLIFANCECGTTLAISVQS